MGGGLITAIVFLNLGVLTVFALFKRDWFDARMTWIGVERLDRLLQAFLMCFLVPMVLAGLMDLVFGALGVEIAFSVYGVLGSIVVWVSIILHAKKHNL